MNRRTAYPSRRRPSSGLRNRLVRVALLAAASCVALLAWFEPDQVLAARSDVADTAVPVLPAPGPSPQPLASAAIARPVYRHSVIAGGVSGPDELARAIKTDKVVAAHYASFDVDKAVKLTVGKPRAVHVSYRKGDKVYWTARKLTLAEGETLLSDGRSEMRARCANRISDLPQLPVELDEPSAEELDSLVGIAMDTAELGLDVADGTTAGLRLLLASSESSSDSNTGRASPGSFSGGRTAPTLPPVSSRTVFGRPGPGDSTSGSTGGTPTVVPPPQGHTGDKGNTPGPTATPENKPATPLPEVRPPAPGTSALPGNLPPPVKEPPAGDPDTPVPPPLPPGSAPLPPVDLPATPAETVHEVPEPTTLWLSAVALAAMLTGARRKR